MTQIRIDPTLTVDEVMRRWPATIAVFIRHRMGCVGCSIGPFHSIEDSSNEHDIPLPTLLTELETAVRGDLPQSSYPRRSAPEHADRGR